jgi:hypothetical protein
MSAAAAARPAEPPAAARASPPAKPPRACPDDFDAAYIAFGYDECELIFRAAPMTVKRWLLERGAERLRKARAEFVARERAARHALKAMKKRRKPPRAVVADGIAVPPALLAEAADFLRTMRNGGWFVAATGKGDWWLGTMYKTPAQIVEFAAARGFDLEAAMARLRCVLPVEDAAPPQR